MADIVIDLREIRDDIGSITAGCDDVMDAREVRGVLAQDLGRMVGQLDGGESGSALLR